MLFNLLDNIINEIKQDTFASIENENIAFEFYSGSKKSLSRNKKNIPHDNFYMINKIDRIKEN